MKNLRKSLSQPIIIFLTVFVILIVGYLSISATKKTPAVKIPQKFAESSLATNAYQIFPGPMSAQTTKMIAGFDVKTAIQPDGSTLVSLTSTNSEYKNQQYIVKTGETLYFIEKNGGDDSSNQDFALTDDNAVVVNTDGYVVGQ